MFVGHLALALAAKRAVPSPSRLADGGRSPPLDLLWPLFLLAHRACSGESRRYGLQPTRLRFLSLVSRPAHGFALGHAAGRFWDARVDSSRSLYWLRPGRQSWVWTF